jgi:hypothetical protein
MRQLRVIYLVKAFSRYLTLQQDPMSMNTSMKIFKEATTTTKIVLNPIFSPKPLRNF